ncbi:hypothetical protein E2C01_041225 [Portunus trituberculatus]|uniref:Uncharacterized protein n=1 Tax=Portunus trituberculatus TaxID=210409 RepID=A0A5B7FQ46_PORTR|nr:hypothetical protein [Portunus trituberculatus]
MTIPDPARHPPSPPVVAGDTLTSLTMTEEEVRVALIKLDEDKAVRPDELSPHVLCLLVVRPPIVIGAGSSIHRPLHQAKVGTSSSARPITLPDVLSIDIYLIMKAMIHLRREKKKK